MKIIDCYYIKGNGTDSKCYKIHGVGIAYNITTSLVYCKGVMIASGVLAIHPLVVCLGLGVGQGFVNGAVQYIKGGGI